MNLPLELRGAMPRWLTHSALGLRAGLHRLGDALVPPEVLVFDESAGALRTQVYHSTAQLKLADLLANGPRTASDLAQESGVDPELLERFLRAAAALGIFHRENDGRFANTPRSLALKHGQGRSLRDWVLYFGSKATQTAWLELIPGLTSSALSPFRRVHDGTVWDHFARFPEEGKVFADAMGTMTAMDAPGIAKAYNFSRFEVLCDLGGGRGTLLSEIVRQHPTVQGVLFDTAPMLEKAKTFLAERGVDGRIECVEGNFFEAAPTHCDAYLLKDVLHDWDDDDCVKILSTARRAMKPEARLLLVELLLEDDLYSPLADLMMMVVTDSGRQRTLAQLHELLARAGLTPVREVRSRTFPTLIEAR